MAANEATRGCLQEFPELPARRSGPSHGSADVCWRGSPPPDIAKLLTDLGSGVREPTVKSRGGAFRVVAVECEQLHRTIKSVPF